MALERLVEVGPLGAGVQVQLFDVQRETA